MSTGTGRDRDSGMTAKGETLNTRALWVTGPRQVELRDEQVPAPAAGEVRIRALASGISQGTELLVYRGLVPADLPLDLSTLAGSFAFPIKYGYASVGRVCDVGPDVTELRLGDLVFTHHPHQSAYVVPAALPVHLPSALERDPVLGIFFANVETALNVLLDTPLRLGESAVVFGAGTVGLLIAQLLRLAGAVRVVVVDPLAARRDLALLIGADAVLAPGDGLAAQLTMDGGKRAPDVAIEASGAPSALQAAIDVVADEGTVVAVSWYGTKPVTLALGGHFHRGRLRLRSSQVGQLNPALGPRWDRARRTAVAVDLLARLRLEPLISHRIPLLRAAEAYRLLDERPEAAGQVVLTYDDDET